MEVIKTFINQIVRQKYLMKTMVSLSKNLGFAVNWSAVNGCSETIADKQKYLKTIDDRDSSIAMNSL